MYNNVQNNKSFKTKIFNLMQQQSVSKVIQMGSKIKKTSPHKSISLFQTFRQNNKFVSHNNFSEEKKKNSSNFVQKKNISLNKKKSQNKFNISKSSSMKHVSSLLKSNPIQKTSDKKSYLLETLKKMQSARKDLSKTFDNYDTTFTTKRYQKQKSKPKKNKSKANKMQLQKQQNYSSNKKLKSSISKDLNFKETPSKKHLSSHKKSFRNQQHIQEIKMIKILRKHLIQPNTFIAILKNQYLNIYYRVVGRCLIELQIHVVKAIDQLWLKLLKGNLQCQAVDEHYKNLRKKQIITLLSSVRSINLQQNLFNLPLLQIQINSQNQNQHTKSKTAFDKLKKFQIYQTSRKKYCWEAVIPFSWMMITQNTNLNKSKQDQLQTSRIKNKTMIQQVQLQDNWQKYLNIFQLKNCKKNKNTFYSFFQLQNRRYRIDLILKKSYIADIVLQGKGQQEMQKLITFIQKVIKINKKK